MKYSSLRERIRGYEDAYRIKLPRRTPLIIRVDGRAFHTLTRGLVEPWDVDFACTMDKVASDLLREVSGAKVAYVQSDEITLLVTDYDTYETQPWFDKGLQKIVSVSASIATRSFNTRMSYYSDSPRDEKRIYADKAYATFDSRAFVVPREEVCNVFVDRQQDCIRNSILNLGQTIIGKKAIHEMSCEDIKNTLRLRDSKDAWESKDPYWKYGRVVTAEGGTHPAPVFTEDRKFIDKFVWLLHEEGQYSHPESLGCLSPVPEAPEPNYPEKVDIKTVPMKESTKKTWKEKGRPLRRLPGRPINPKVNK